MTGLTPLPVFMVYDKPKDFPEFVVVRELHGVCLKSHALLFKDMEDARFYLDAQNLVPAEALRQRDPKAVEAWI